jgi:threonine aldolase
VSLVIDLRSDTVTKPTPEMYAAIAAAELGDEQRREDPTVNELQDRAAELLGQETALFVPTATMANQIALRLLGRRGGELLAEERTHVLVYESGGAAAHSGLVMRGVPAEAGWLTPAHLHEWATLCDGVLQPPSVVVLEQTHRSAGGRVWPLDLFERTVAAARELGVGVHLDGARLFNASVASGVAAATWGRLADTVTVCFSKGLGCPMGAVLATSAERIEEAWRCKFQFGGALRQAGIVAAAMLYALEHHVERLADDHGRARRLADGLARAGLPVDATATESNFVAIDVRPLGLAALDAVARIAEAGVLVSTLRPGVLRAVTYLGIDDEAIETAIDAIPQALGARVSA